MMWSESRRGCIGCLIGLCNELYDRFFALGYVGARVRSNFGKFGFEKYTVI